MASAPAKKKKSGGLTLLVILVLAGLAACCVLAMAAVAIPQLVHYLASAKTAEAEANLRTLYAGAAAYYAREHVGPDGTVRTRCTVAPAVTSNTPGPGKSLLGPLPESFRAIGFEPLDPVYYQYEIVSVPGCDHPDGTPLYTFRAHGDLDGDGVRSLYELTASSALDGTLERSPTVTARDGLE